MYNHEHVSTVTLKKKMIKVYNQQAGAVAAAAAVEVVVVLFSFATNCTLSQIENISVISIKRQNYIMTKNGLSHQQLSLLYH